MRLSLRLSAFTLLLVFAGSTVFAFQFGYVDAAKIFAKYSETQKTKELLESEKAKLQKQLDAKKQELTDLNTRYMQTAKQIQDLRDAKKEAEAKKLEPKLKAEREALANANSEIQKFFEESQKRLYELEDEKMGALSKTLDDTVDLVIKKIAAAKGLEAVFEKRFCYFGGIDITDEVLAELNKGKAPATAAPAATPAPATAAPARPKSK
ncbi:MAG: Outer membrane protein H precursor [Candidatus Ozemobacter sibiricus]|uniref:Outer membrane protein H n=1 Tax=Candidatus Ozemobacter sibiricus TaxID=2268124 RepID=A0A367ZR53_9BACT|nr:MAG: Outer membrane protein H precursor [Candidatus Ozemobacter sibiricus]